MALYKCNTCNTTQDPHEGKDFGILSGSRISVGNSNTPDINKPACTECGSQDMEMITLI
jgi:hypothetical protein